MTVQEYIDKNLPFYHITPAINKDGILKDGLHRGKNYNAICVVRSDKFSILYDIASSQLSYCNGIEYNDFIVIKLIPSKHGINAMDVAPDNVTDITNPLHNYIVEKTLQVTEDDIVLEFSISLPTIVKNEDVKDELTDYKRGYRPNFKLKE